MLKERMSDATLTEGERSTVITKNIENMTLEGATWRGTDSSVLQRIARRSRANWVGMQVLLCWFCLSVNATGDNAFDSPASPGSDEESLHDDVTQVSRPPEDELLAAQVLFACEETPYTCVGEGVSTVCTCECIETSYAGKNLQSIWLCPEEQNDHCMTGQEEMEEVMSALRSSDRCACDESGCSCTADDCCWCESNNGFYTAHDTCARRKLYDLENVVVQMTNPGDSATNYTYRYLDFVLEDVDSAALEQQSGISSSREVVNTVIYGSHFRERVSTGQTASYTIKSYIACGFYEAVYEMHVARKSWPRIPVTLRFVHKDGSTPTELVDVERQGLCSAPWSSLGVTANGGFSFFITGAAGSTVTWNTCSNSYKPAYTTSSGYSLYRLRVGNEGVSSQWSRLFFKVEGDASC